MDAKRRKTDVISIEQEAEARFVFGAQQLIRDLGSDRLRAGVGLHILSGGNIDQICYVRWILESYGHIDRLLVCGWAISASNLLLIKRWVESGKVGEVVLIVGGVYSSRYKKEWELVMRMRSSGQLSSVITGHLHCKILLASCGPSRLVLEGSANCNCNPRVEQTVLMDSPDLYNFYEGYFSKDAKESHLVNATVY